MSGISFKHCTMAHCPDCGRMMFIRRCAGYVEYRCIFHGHVWRETS